MARMLGNCCKFCDCSDCRKNDSCRLLCGDTDMYCKTECKGELVYTVDCPIKFSMKGRKKNDRTK